MGYSTLAGALTQTRGALDVAIDGTGFIEVTRADGSPAYTRAGSLKINAQGMLATQAGDVLAAKIAIPTDAQSITIAPDGHVYAVPANSTTQVDLGQIDLVEFTNPQGMQAAGGTLYVPGPDSGDPRPSAPGTNGLGALRAGYLESSNVDIATEFTHLMTYQRSYEANSRTITTIDQMVQDLMQMKP